MIESSFYLSLFLQNSNLTRRVVAPFLSSLPGSSNAELPAVVLSSDSGTADQGLYLWSGRCWLYVLPHPEVILSIQESRPINLYSGVQTPVEVDSTDVDFVYRNGQLLDLSKPTIIQSPGVYVTLGRKALNRISDVSPADIGALPISSLGSPNGVAPLNSEGKVDSSYLDVTSAVTSVAGKSGNVTLTTADIESGVFSPERLASGSSIPGSVLTRDSSGTIWVPLENQSQVQVDWNAESGITSIANRPNLGTAAFQDTEVFATASQGIKADTAVQPADLVGYATQTYVNDAVDIATLDLVEDAPPDGKQYLRQDEEWVEFEKLHGVPVALDPVMRSPGTVLTTVDGLDQIELTGTTQESIFCNTELTRGKWYCEIVFVQGTTSSNCSVGLCARNEPLENQIGYDSVSNAVGIFQSSGRVYVSSSSYDIELLPFSTPGDRVDFAIDTDSRLVWIRVNGGLWNDSETSDPDTSTEGILVPGTLPLVFGLGSDEAASFQFNTGRTGSFDGIMPGTFNALDSYSGRIYSSDLADGTSVATKQYVDSKTTISTSQPSGGNPGDVWFVVDA